MSLRDLEIRMHTQPIQAELDKQKDKNGILKKKNKQLLRALKFFIDGYPNDEWTKHLHEEGCPGATWRKNERDVEDQCKCDGDYMEDEVRKALKEGA